MAPLVPRAPAGFGRLLSALDFHLSRPKEVAIVWREEVREAAPLLDVVHGGYWRDVVLAGGAEGRDGDLTPLLDGRSALGGRPTAYVCERFLCQAPTTDPAELRRQLLA
jgi:hypothetical protein